MNLLMMVMLEKSWLLLVPVGSALNVGQMAWCIRSTVKKKENRMNDGYSNRALTHYQRT